MYHSFLTKWVSTSYLIIDFSLIAVCETAQASHFITSPLSSQTSHKRPTLLLTQKEKNSDESTGLTENKNLPEVSRSQTKTQAWVAMTL